jgi:hypothetical protein
MNEGFIDVVLVLGVCGEVYWLTSDPAVTALWQAVTILVRPYHRNYWQREP